MQAHEIVNSLMGFIETQEIPVERRALCWALDYVDRTGLIDILQFMKDSTEADTDEQVTMVNEQLSKIVELSLAKQEDMEVEDAMWDDYMQGLIDLGVDEQGKVVPMSK